MAVIDRDKQKINEEIQIGKEKFELWLDECEDMNIRMYISDLMRRHEHMSGEIKEYSEFFNKLAYFMPPAKYVAPPRF